MEMKNCTELAIIRIYDGLIFFSTNSHIDICYLLQVAIVEVAFKFVSTTFFCIFIIREKYNYNAIMIHKIYHNTKNIS